MQRAEVTRRLVVCEPEGFGDLGHREWAPSKQGEGAQADRIAESAEQPTAFLERQRIEFVELAFGIPAVHVPVYLAPRCSGRIVTGVGDLPP